MLFSKKSETKIEEASYVFRYIWTMEGYFLNIFRPNRARPISPTPNNSTLAGSGTYSMNIVRSFLIGDFK